MSEAIEAHKNDFPINGFHHIEFWVDNAYQTAHYYRAVHGPGVRDVAVDVPDAGGAFELAIERSADVAYEPTTLESERGTWTTAGIRAYGDTIHSLVEDREAVWLPPDFRTRKDGIARPIGLVAIDHVVANVGLGDMDEWVEHYERVFDFVLLRHFDDEAISTEYSALMSKVVWDGSGVIRFPINEPAPGKRKSQIEEYLDFYGGPGVQHIAIATASLIDTVAEVRTRGMGLMRVPDSYYDDVAERVPDLEVDIDTIRTLNILVDQDGGGHLLQIFTSMAQDRPTFFYEFIERRGAIGFGEGNFKALFEAIERDQMARGNL